MILHFISIPHVTLTLSIFFVCFEGALCYFRPEKLCFFQLVGLKDLASCKSFLFFLPGISKTLLSRDITIFCLDFSSVFSTFLYECRFAPLESIQNAAAKLPLFKYLHRPLTFSSLRGLSSVNCYQELSSHWLLPAGAPYQPPWWFFWPQLFLTLNQSCWWMSDSLPQKLFQFLHPRSPLQQCLWKYERAGLLLCHAHCS